ncbi:hypothetical protein VNO78_11812 [Psophocarpus tetragonolobus]|uniref:Uncharacterized protein n=1 Tax=Psophocarpus tetragonolobus TaxID=3891 RepID=A0AAN9SMG4_PSOTE
MKQNKTCFELFSSYQKKGIISNSNKGAEAFQACDNSSSYVASVLACHGIRSRTKAKLIFQVTLHTSGPSALNLVLHLYFEHANAVYNLCLIGACNQANCPANTTQLAIINYGIFTRKEDGAYK